MFAVIVTFRFKADKADEFLPLMKLNASRSLADEPGCQRFDVCEDDAHPNEVFLYELYDDRAAFDAHLASPHFKDFDAAVADMIVEKDVRTYAQVTS